MKNYILLSCCFPWAVTSLSTTTKPHGASSMSRGQFFVTSSSLVTAAMAARTVLSTLPACAQEEKQLNLSNEQLEKIVRQDVLDRHFLVSGDLTRSVYDESATFTDEIDTYGLEQWTKGTQKLFVAEGSTLNLVGDIDVNKDRVEFRFDEQLMFRVPFRPVVSLTGRVVLKRNQSNGLISSYREYWDQDVASVLKTAKF